MIIDGAEPDLILDLLETWRDTMLRQHEMSMDMIIAGLLAVSAGDNPLMVQLREQAWYRTELEIDVDDSMDVPRLKQQLKKRPHAHMSLDERATCMAQLSAIARREGTCICANCSVTLGMNFLRRVCDSLWMEPNRRWRWRSSAPEKRPSWTGTELATAWRTDSTHPP